MRVPAYRTLSLKIAVGLSLIASGVVAVQVPVGALPAEGGQTTPPPVINMSLVPAADLGAVETFEQEAVDQVLETHGLPQSEYDAVLGWARNDVRAQEFLNLMQIVNDAPNFPTADDALVYNWFQYAYHSQLEIPEAQDAVDEYQLWSGLPIGSTVPPESLGAPVTTSLRGTSETIGSGYCNYQPPGGSSGPFAGTYEGNQDETCFGPCPEEVTFCTAPYPTVQQFQEWGTFDALGKEMSAPDFTLTSMSTAAVVGIGASLLVAGVSTALSLAFGGGAAASTVASVIFPYAADAFFTFASQAGSVAAAAAANASAAADAAISAASLGAGAIAFVVGIVIFFVVSTTLEIIQLAQDAAVPAQLEDALSQAQQDTATDLASVANSSGTSGLYDLFVAETQPDVDYDCTLADSDPCANAPAPAAQDTATDPQFEVTTTGPDGPTTVISPTIYTSEVVGDTNLLTRLSGHAWFVSTKYSAADAANANGPSGPPGATFQTLQFFYTDWSGDHWMAEMLPSSSGVPEFAITPLDQDNGTACTDPTLAATAIAQACVTNTIDVQEPDGTDASVTVVAAAAAAPRVNATVPAAATVGQSTPLNAAGTDPDNLPLSFSWLVECPGTTTDSLGYIGFSCDLTGSGIDAGPLTATVPGASTSFTFQQPGLYPVTVTATDTDGYSSSRTYQVQVTGATTTTVSAAWAGEPGAHVYGQPVTYTATVAPVACQCSYYYPGGSVQFYVDGTPNGAPVALVQSGASTATATTQISDLSVTPSGTAGHVVTAQFVPGPQSQSSGLGPPVPIVDALQGFLSSSGAAPPVTVGEGATATQVVAQPTPPATLVYGQPLSVMATVAPTGDSTLTPTGAVQFTVNGSPDGAPVPLDASGEATADLTDLPVTATCNIFLICLGDQIGATYVGDAGYQSSVSAVLDDIFVGLDFTTTTAGVSPTTPVVGQPTSLIATVLVPSPGGATPTGTFTFTDGTTTLGTVPILGSFQIPSLSGPFGETLTFLTYYYADLTTSALSEGAQTITAMYNGDPETSPSSAQETFTVTRATATATTLATTRNAVTVTLGTTPTTLTDSATLSGGSTSPGPTGTITFTLYYNGGPTPIDTETVMVSGDGTYSTPTGYTLSTSGSATGTYHWDVTYSGDTDNAASSDSDDPNELVMVSPATSAVGITLSAGPITAGGLASGTATLTAMTSGAGGAVDYRYYTSVPACLTDVSAFPGTAPSGGTDVGTVTVTNGSVPPSPTVAFPVPGTYYWAAFYSGDANNQPAVSGCATGGLVVNRLAQTISWAAPGPGTVAGSSFLSAAGGASGNPVIFSLDVTSGPGVCTLSGTDFTTVKYAAVGSCVIDANQAGDTNYASAAQVQKTIPVGPATVPVGPATVPVGPATVPVGPATVAVNVNVSGSQVYGSSNATLSETNDAVVVSVLGTLACRSVNEGTAISASLPVGTYTVDGNSCSGLSQSGPGGYSIAYAGASGGFVVTQAPQAINFTTPASVSVGTSATFSAIGGASGNPVVFTLNATSGTGVCNLSGPDGTTVKYKAAGHCVIDANQIGDHNHSAAPQVRRTIAVKATERIFFGALGRKTLAQSPVTVTAVASSGLTVSFTTKTPLVCTSGKRNGATITLTGPGTCTVEATQGGSATYSAATPVYRSFRVSKALGPARRSSSPRLR
jgi:hypothetical protein